MITSSASLCSRRSAKKALTASETSRQSSAWVANAGDDTVTRVRDRRAVEVGDNPRDLVFDRGAVWVANAGDDTVVRIDARSAEVDADPVKVGDDPIGIAVGKKAVWATGFRDDTLSRIPAGG